MNLKQALNFSAAVSAALSAIIVASCDDRLTIPGYVEADGYVKFGVTVTEPWSNGHTAASRAADDVRIEPTVTETGDTLYLVTRVQSCNDSIVTLADLDKIVSSRGKPVNDKSGFWTSFGVTAIVSEGDTYADEDNVSGRRIADNEKITGDPSADSWYVPQTLAWPAAGKTRFCAYAPHSKDAKALIYGGDSDSDTGTPVLGYTVPKDIKEQIDLMYCVTDPLTESDNAVTLAFKHALAAVTVKCQKMLPGSITKVTVSGIYGSGTFSFIPDESGAQWTITDTDTPESSYEFTFEKSQQVSDKEVTILDGEMTLLMIPQSLGSDAKIQFEYTDEFSGTRHLLSATIGGEGKSWEAGNRYIYSLSTSPTIFTPVCEDFKIENYGAYDEKTSGDDELKIGNEVIKCKGMIPVSGILEKVSLKAGFQTSALGDDNSVMTKNVKADYLNETDRKDKTKPGWWFTYVVDGGSDHKNANFYPLEDDVVAAVAEAEQSLSVQLGRLQFEPQSEWENKLKLSGDEVGKADNYYDLSKAGGTTESSNCYVINAPGYYKLPLVYGNSLGHGTEVIPAGSEYKDYADNVISSGIEWIKTNYTPNDCVLMWQDSPGLVTDVKLDGDYLTFRARPESFAQGNAVVAVRDGSGTVLWSWHIWATKSKYYHTDCSKDNVCYNATIVDSEAGTEHEYSFGCANVGYCDPNGAAPERTMTLSLYVHFRMPDGTEKDITVFENKELTQEALQESVAGDNTYYQWGRKDPMLGGVYGSSTFDLGSGKEGYKNNENDLLNGIKGKTLENQFDISNKRYYPGNVRFKRVESRQTIAYSIKHPNEFILGTFHAANAGQISLDTRRHWRAGAKNVNKMVNSWDVYMVEDKYDPSQQLKSIYDPSPRGYRVPPSGAFSVMRSNADAIGGYDGQNNHGKIEKIVSGSIVAGYRISDNNGNITFPLTGVRDVGPKRSDEYFDILPDLLKKDIYNQWTFSNFNSEFDYTWPAHRKVTFVASSSIKADGGGSATATADVDVVSIFLMDNRSDKIQINISSLNGYGFTVRPVKGMSMGL